jgi:sec-independent protein translocase protein TatA
MVAEGLSNLIMQFAGLGGWEWVIIIGLIVVVFFGVKKIPELARSFGKATAEFEKARIEAKRELQQMKSEGGGRVGREKLESIADSLGIDYTNKNDDELRAAIEVELNKNKP